MTIDGDLISIVDQRIRAHDKVTALMGTVVTRDTTGPGATVLFDGSTVAVPVKCEGHVFCQPGDRVSLFRYGSDWLIVGSFSGPGFGSQYRILFGLPSSTGTLTSASFVDLVEFGTFRFTKFYDNTFVRMAVVGGSFSSVGGQILNFGLRFNIVSGGVGYTVRDYQVTQNIWSTGNVHQPVYGHVRTSDMPAGTYTVSLRWKKAFGSGYFLSDGNDYFSIEVDERVNPSSPVL